MRRTLSFLLLLLLGCATTPELFPEQPLADQRLKLRTDRVGELTYSVCLAKDPKTGHCTNQVIKGIDLRKESERKRLNDLNFVCNLNGDRFKICKDSAGLCEIGRKKECTLVIFCKETPVVVRRIDAVEDAQRLIDAGTRCFSRDKYPFN